VKVLVTGGAGYVGSHVVRRLVRAGWDVLVVDDLSTGHGGALDGAPLLEGRLGEPECMERLRTAGPFAAVVHLAALALVEESVRDPSRYYANNLVAGLSLLDLVRRERWGGIVFSSTAAVYGDPVAVPITEEHPTRPVNPYGHTKLAFEHALADYERAFGLPFASLRYFNAAGADPEGGLGEDHGAAESHLIPRILRVALEGKGTVRLFGEDYPTPDGTAIRDYVHVTDLADAHLLALDRLGRGASGIYNLGTGRGFSVRQVIEACQRLSGRQVPVVVEGRRAGDPAVLVASSERAVRELGWRPRRTDLDTVVGTAWEWHRTHPEGYARTPAG
jgi:UDP-glucose 4-epimerase